LTPKEDHVNRRFSLFIFLLVALPLLIGCGHPWQSVATAVPNPFVGQRRFAVFPVTYNGLMVGDKRESDYLSEKDGEKWTSWQADKQAINDKYTADLIAEAANGGIQVVQATGPGAATYFIRPNITLLEPGFFTAFVNKSSELRMNVQITDPTGRILDEILIHRVVGNQNEGIISAAINGTVTSGGRLQQAAEQAGEVTGKYLRFRVSGED
jgi:hypothetical protein